MNNRKIVKNYLLNTLYQLLVVVAPLLTMPYVSRVLGVTNISIYNYAQSIATYFVLVGAVGTTLYGQREIAYLQDQPERRTTAFWEIEAFRCAAVLVCAAVYSLAFCGDHTYALVNRVLLFEVIATAFDISWFFMGLENFTQIVIRNTIIKLTGVVCVFLFVKTADDLEIYTVCVTAPVLLGNISLWFVVRRYLVRVRIGIGPLLRGIGKRLGPIFVLFLPQIAIDVYTVLDKTMIGVLASDIDQVGYYSQAQKIVKIVLTLVTSLGTVMLPTMSAAYARGNTEDISRGIGNAFRFIFMLSFALMFGICSIARRFVPVFFGPGYDLVVPLMIVISPILVIIAISNVLGRQYLIPTNQHRSFTISILVGAGINCLLNFMLIRRWNAVGASIATVVAELAVAVVQCLFVRKQLPLKVCLLSGLRYLAFGAIMFFAVRGIGMLLPAGRIWPLILMIAAGMLVYALELFATKDPMLKQGAALLRKR